MQGENAQNPSVTDVVWSIAAGLDGVRNAFGVTLHPEINSRDSVRDGTGALFHSGDQRFQGFVKTTGKKRVLRLFVLSQIREVRLRGKSGIVLEAEEFFEKISMQEKRRLTEGSRAEKSFFNEITAFQEFLWSVPVFEVFAGRMEC